MAKLRDYGQRVEGSVFKVEGGLIQGQFVKAILRVISARLSREGAED